MSNPRITLEVTTENGTVRRGFIGSACVRSAQFWVKGKAATAKNLVVRVIEGTPDTTDIMKYLPVQEAQGPESPEDCEDDRAEPPTCPMCDGIHGGRHCPLEDRGWDQCLEPWWAQ